MVAMAHGAVLLSWDWCLFILHISIITRSMWVVRVFHWSTDTIGFSRIRPAVLPRPGTLSFLYFDRKHISSFNLVYQVFNMICHIFYACLASQLTLPSSHACSIWAEATSWRSLKHTCFVVVVVVWFWSLPGGRLEKQWDFNQLWASCTQHSW